MEISNLHEMKQDIESLREKARLLYKLDRSDQDQIDDIVDEASAAAIQIQENFRKVINHHKQLKSDSLATKQEMTKSNLTFQNINYEMQHVLNEIKSCEEKETVYQHVPLVDYQVFVNTAPTDLSAVENEHEIMLNRLKFELMERKRFDFLIIRVGSLNDIFL